MKGCVEFFSSSYNNANPPLIFLLKTLQGTYYFQILGADYSEGRFEWEF